MSDIIINGINVNKNKTEEFYSSVIAAILNYSDQNYSVFKSFLKLADKVSDNRLPIFSNLPVHSPIIKAEKHEIDVLINDNNYRIIIENKINHANDLLSQLARYIDGSINGAHYFEKDVYVIYITDDKKEPSRQSWIRMDKKLIATDYKDDFQKRFVNITRTDICKWLEEDIKDLHIDDPTMNGFINISAKLFSKEINECDFKNHIANINSDKIMSESDNRIFNFQKTLTHWKEIIESHYSKDIITSVKVGDSCLEIIFQWKYKEQNYKLRCRLEILKDTQKIRYVIYNEEEDNTHFTYKFFQNIFDLFFNVDRYFDRYNWRYAKNRNTFHFNKTNSSDYYVFMESEFGSYSDHEFQFILKYYLLDLIDKIIMFIIAPSQLGLLNTD